MNYNYPYLAGYLKSALKMLAADHKFLDLTNTEDRQKYIEDIIKEAHESMVKNAI